jgi:hypothetical protein
VFFELALYGMIRRMEFAAFNVAAFYHNLQAGSLERVEILDTVGNTSLENKTDRTHCKRHLEIVLKAWCLIIVNWR